MKYLTLLLAIWSTLLLGQCPSTADYVDPSPFPTSLTLNMGDTLMITSDLAASTSIAVKNGGVILICNNSIFTVTGSISVSNRGTIEFYGCSELHVNGSYAGDHLACELLSYCANCNDVGYYPLTMIAGPKVWDGLCCQTPLPIELLLFSGEAVGSSNELFWVTGSEINNDYFTLESSPDAIQWTEVHRRDGTNTSIVQTYRYVQEDITGTLYYRLKQTDYDLTYTYSNVIVISRDGIAPVELYRVNTLGQIVNMSYKGLVCIVYSDGTTKKVYQ